MPLMHLSEAYYIAAECLRATDIAKARSYMDTIMAARGRQALASDISEADLLTEIKLEYMREMAGEGQVFYMLTGSTSASDARYVVPLPESELINR